MSKEVFATRLREALNKTGMTQREFAEKANLTEITISRYLNSERFPKVTEIVTMANALNVSPNDLFGYNQEDEKKVKNPTVEQMVSMFYNESGKEKIRYQIQICTDENESFDGTEESVGGVYLRFDTDMELRVWMPKWLRDCEITGWWIHSNRVYLWVTDEELDKRKKE